MRSVFPPIAIRLLLFFLILFFRPTRLLRRQDACGGSPDTDAVPLVDLLESKPKLEVFLLLLDLRHPNHELFKYFGSRVEVVVVRVLLVELLLVEIEFLVEDVSV